MSSEKRTKGRPRKDDADKVVKGSISWPSDVLESVRSYSNAQGMSFSRAVMELCLIALAIAEKERMQ